MMRWNGCRDARREIDLSELRQQLSDRAREHLASCASCRAFRDERLRLRELVGSLEPVATPADFEMRLRARIQARQQANSRRSFFAIFPVSAPAIAVAAAVMVLAASVAWFVQRGANKTATVVSQAPAQSGKTDAPPRADSSPIDADTTVVSAAVPKAANDSGRSIRNRNASPQSREARAASIQSGLTSKDFGVQPAESIKQSEQSSGRVSLSAPLKPLVLSFQDDNGATRKISLPPVSFGSQRLLESRAIPVSASNARIW